MTTALITGATAGIGLSFVNQLAAEGTHLVVVARRQDRLEELAARLREQHSIEVEVMPADLSVRDDCIRVETRLADLARPVDLLVNNAGFAVNDWFYESTIDQQQEMFDVLVTAVMRLSHAALPVMLSRGHGTIINVSSVAAWIAGGTYSAAKAYCTVFSESLDREVSGAGVRVMALAPGFTHTDFHESAEMNMSGMKEWMWLNSDDVVATALKDARKGKVVSVPGAQYKMLSAMAQYLPRPLVRALSGSRPNERNRVKEASVNQGPDQPASTH
jgi:hypothetical protein